MIRFTRDRGAGAGLARRGDNGRRSHLMTIRLSLWTPTAHDEFGPNFTGRPGWERGDLIITIRPSLSLSCDAN